MNLLQGIKTSGIGAVGGAGASVLRRQLEKIEMIKKYKYGVPIAMFVGGHVIANKVHASAGHAICAVAGYMLAEQLQDAAASGGSGAQGFNDAGYAGELPASYQGGIYDNAPAYAYA